MRKIVSTIESVAQALSEPPKKQAAAEMQSFRVTCLTTEKDGRTQYRISQTELRRILFQSDLTGLPHAEQNALMRIWRSLQNLPRFGAAYADAMQHLQKTVEDCKKRHGLEPIAETLTSEMPETAAKTRTKSQVVPLWPTQAKAESAAMDQPKERNEAPDEVAVAQMEELQRLLAQEVPDPGIRRQMLCLAVDRPELARTLLNADDLLAWTWAPNLRRVVIHKVILRPYDPARYQRLLQELSVQD